MRAPAWRLRKYDAKINADSIRQRFLDHKDTMVEQEEAIFGELVLIESKAKVVCEAAGVPTIQIPFYLNFARQCYKYFKKFSQTTRSNELQYWFNHWVSRGLTGAVLADIAELCGVTIPGYE
jgi:hypothetical protein